MNKIILTTAFVTACGLGAFAVNASAQSMGASATTSTTTTTTTQRSNDTAETAVGARQVPAPGSRNCIRDTGSHIKNREQKCLPLNGNSYSQEDLQRTGNPDLGQALQQLDPAVTSHGH